MEPRHWSAAFWRTMHCAAYAYPTDGSASELQKAAYRNFFVSIGGVLPCDVCSRGYNSMMSAWGLRELDKALDSGELFGWTVRVHNHVNRKLKRSELNVAQARDELLQQVPAPSLAAATPQPTDPPMFYPVAVMSVSMCVGFLMAGAFAALVWLACRLTVAQLARRF